MSENPRPELVVEGLPGRSRPRWVELATSADHKDVSRVLICGALGFLFLALVELTMMRIQLLIPENTFLSPVAFNRMLSVFGSTAIFFFALPLAFGLFYYLVPLQVGARGTGLPRFGQLGLWFWVLGAAVLYGSFMFTPPEAGINPLSPLSDVAFLPNNGVSVWATAVGFATLGFVFMSIGLLATLRNLRAPGMAWRRVPVFSWAAAVSCWLMVVIGAVFLAALTMLMIDRNYQGVFFTDGSGGAPLLWQHLSWIFFSGAYMLILIFAFGAIAEIVATFTRKPLFDRGAVMTSLAAIAVIGTLAWMQNMFTAPIGSGWMDFGMLMALALIVPFGVIFFNLIATMVGGELRLRSPLLFALGAISMISIGLASEIGQSIAGFAWEFKNTTDATAATFFALGGAAVFGGFAALHYWFPKLTGRAMGEALARASFWTMLVGMLGALVPLILAGLIQGQVVDAYKYFADAGVNAYNLIASLGFFVFLIGVMITIVNALVSREGGVETGHDPWGGDSLEWFTLSPPDPHNFDVVPDVRSTRPLHDIRVAIARRDRRQPDLPARERQPVA